MMEQSIDLTHITSQLLSQVPLWGIGWAVFRVWMNRAKQSANRLEERLSELKDHSEENRELIMKEVSGIHLVLTDIKLTMASSGVNHLKENIDKLQENCIRNDIQLTAAWRVLDELKHQPKAVK
jgi:uncharacterized protein YigA (DUF484 family)